MILYGSTSFTTTACSNNCSVTDFYAAYDQYVVSDPYVIADINEILSFRICIFPNITHTLDKKENRVFLYHNIIEYWECCDKTLSGMTPKFGIHIIRDTAETAEFVFL